MVSIMIGRIPDKEGNKDLETAAEMEAVPYDPEVDSPSSWTTKSSHSHQKASWGCGDRLAKCAKVCTSQKAALGTRILSNMILLFLAFCGIIYGILIIIAFYKDDKNNQHPDDLDQNVSGVVIIFGSAVGGAIALILVNLSWSYRGMNHEISLSSRFCGGCCQDCRIPTAQLGGTLIVLMVCAILVPTYRESETAVLVILLGILTPLLIMVNLPMLFDGSIPTTEYDDMNNHNCVSADPSGDMGVPVVPGNLESPSSTVQPDGSKQGFFFKPR